MQDLPANILNINQVLTASDLYDKAKELLHLGKVSFQIYYNGIQIPK